MDLLVTTPNVDINTTSPQDVFTVPAGKKLMLICVAFSEPTDGPFDGGNVHQMRVHESLNGSVMAMVSVNAASELSNYVVANAQETPRLIEGGGKVQVRPDAAYGSANTCTVRIFGILFE